MSVPADTPIFSVAIPAYNEAALLPRLLASIEAARANYRGGRDQIEIIVGNNASTDATAEIARSFGASVVDVATRRIGAVRNGAAGVARGKILCFIDADSIVHPDTFNQIETVMRSGRCAIGATGVRMERMSPGIAVAYYLMFPLTFLLGYDTGVVFCRRADFISVGGYRDDVLAAEDVEFMARMKKLGRSRRQRFVRTRDARAITSTRKFDRHGDWHYVLELLLLLPLRFVCSRESARRFAWKYWYADR